MLTVFLGNKYIRAVEGEFLQDKLKVRGMYRAVDFEGAILNGTIMEEDALFAMLEKMWEEHDLPKRDVNLVLDSGQITQRLLKTPAIAEKKMMDYLSREFTGVDRIANPVYGYFPLKKEDKKTGFSNIVAMAAPRDYVEQFLKLFARLGVTVSSVEGSNGALIRLVSFLPVLKNKTCIVQFVDDMSLTSVLLLDGQYETSNKKRLFSEPGTPEYCVEAARAVSSLLQFSKAQNMEKPITNVYIAGLSAADYEIYEENVMRIDPNLLTEPLNGDGCFTNSQYTKEEGGFSEYALAIGGLIKTNPKTNIITQMAYTPKQIAARKARNRILIPVLCAVGVLAVLSLALFGRKLFLENKLSKLTEYNQNPEVLASCESYDALNQKLLALSGIENGLALMEERVTSYPRPNSDVEFIIESCADGLVSAEIKSYDAATGVLTFNTSAKNVEQINHFIDLLINETVFASVDYTGYAQDEEGVWSVNVNCTMAPGLEAKE